MIQKISIENFKSIFKTDIEIGELNLFTGINGSGKSSFLQSLLLLRQSYISGNLFKPPFSLTLGDNDKLINLGYYKDVLCQQSRKGEEKINIKIKFVNSEFSFSSHDYNTDNRFNNFITGNINHDIFHFESETLFTDRCQYLAADRIQPKEDYSRFQNTELLGKNGEYTAHYIEKYGKGDISIKELSLKENPISYSLINTLNDWMGEISKSIEIVTEENLTTNKIELSYRYKLEDGTPTQNQKPQNVGFGITYTLPILVAILSARKNDLIIIENPETHLHPKAQSIIARLFCKAAQNGVQIFIETHSDHIINGIRVSVKNELIEKEKVFINYFSKNTQLLSDNIRIKIQSGGGLSSWPDGFFDEWDNLLNELL